MAIDHPMASRFWVDEPLEIPYEKRGSFEPRLMINDTMISLHSIYPYGVAEPSTTH
jgi:hypothetical protein